jgi:hypothetical protein
VKKFDELISGNDDVVLLRPKSAKQLKDYFEYLKKTQAAATFINPDNPYIQKLTAVLKDTQMRMPPGQIPQLSKPVQYISPGPRPFGTATLSANPAIAAAAMMTRTTADLKQTPGKMLSSNMKSLSLSSTPWKLKDPPPQQPTHDAMFGFNYRKFCITCGFTKRYHGKVEGYGKKCKVGYCAKCKRLQQYHTESDGKMGPNCRAPESEFADDSPHKEWYVSLEGKPRPQSTTKSSTTKSKPKRKKPPQPILVAAKQSATTAAVVPAAAKPSQPIPATTKQSAIMANQLWTLTSEQLATVEEAVLWCSCQSTGSECTGS